MFLFVAKHFSVSREIVFISRGARGFEGRFGNMKTELARATAHTDKEPVFLNTTAWESC